MSHRDVAAKTEAPLKAVASNFDSGAFSLAGASQLPSPVKKGGRAVKFFLSNGWTLAALVAVFHTEFVVGDSVHKNVATRRV